jgi:hypothetical protein
MDVTSATGILDDASFTITAITFSFSQASGPAPTPVSLHCRAQNLHILASAASRIVKRKAKENSGNSLQRPALLIDRLIRVY